MVAVTRIHQDFDGYAAGSIETAERYVRERIGELVNGLAAKIRHCSVKARENGRIKLLSEIEPLRNRIEKIQRRMTESESIYFPPHIRQGMAKVDDAAVRECDRKIEMSLNSCSEIADSLTCAESDTHIIERFSAMAGYLRKFETLYAERRMALKKEKRINYFI